MASRGRQTLDYCTFGISLKFFEDVLVSWFFGMYRKGSSGATSLENNSLAMSSIARSTETLVKRRVTSKLTSLTSFVGLSSLILLIKLGVENKGQLSAISGLIKESNHLAMLCSGVLTMEATGLMRHPVFYFCPDEVPEREKKLRCFLFSFIKSTLLC